MDEKLEQLMAKVERVSQVLDTLKSDNKQLRTENTGLKSEMARLQKELDTVRLSTTDHSEAVKGKLGRVLERLEQLETISVG
jgi:regulator of replication initiation timing